MLERGCHQALEPRAITPPKLQAKIHDDAIAEHVTESVRTFRVNQNLSKRIFDVHTAQEDSSTTTVGLPHELLPALKPHEARGQARTVARNPNPGHRQHWSDPPRAQT